MAGIRDNWRYVKFPATVSAVPIQTEWGAIYGGPRRSVKSGKEGWEEGLEVEVFKGSEREEKIC